MSRLEELRELDKQLKADMAEAVAMNLALPPEASAYDLEFINEKLAKVGSYMSTLSNMLARHSVINLEVAEVEVNLKNLPREKERELKASPDYDSLPLNQKANWIDRELKSVREENAFWFTLSRTVSEVRRTVLGRMDDMKRLESTIRLQSKILEARVASGATSNIRFPTGHSKGDLDLN